jgi:hypothetical protein
MDRNRPGRGCIRVGGKEKYQFISPSKDVHAYIQLSGPRPKPGRAVQPQSAFHYYFLLYYQSSLPSVLLTGDMELGWPLY